MADNIQFGMAVEIQEAIQQITKFGDGVVQSVDEIKKQLDRRFNASDIVTPTIANLGAEFDGLNVSINDLLGRLDDLRGYRNAAAINSEAWHRWNREIQAVQSELQKARSTINSTDGAIVQTGKSVTNFTRYDLRLFASQMFSTVGATGKLGTQLSSLAIGLATGGVIGAAFAGASALINTLTEKTKEWSAALASAADKLIEIQDPLSGLKFSIPSEDLDTLILRLKTIVDALKSVETTGLSAYVGPNVARILSDLGIVPNNQLSANQEILGVLERKLSMLQAEKIISDELEKLNVKKIKTAEKEVKSLTDSLIMSDEQLLNKIKEIDKALKNPLNSEREINLLLEQRKKYTNDLIGDWKIIGNIIDENIKKANELMDSDLQDISLPSFALSTEAFFPLGAGMTNELREQTELIKEQANYWGELENITASVGEKMLNTWGGLPLIFRRNNSLLQQFTNQISAALLKALALKAALLFGGFITSIFGGGIPAIATLAAPGGGPSNPISIGGGGSNFNTPISSRSTITNIIQPVAVSVDGRIRGRDIYMANRNENNLRSEFT